MSLFLVGAALAGRSYAQSGNLVIKVHDSFCPWNEGSFELEGSPGGAECVSSTTAPDLVLSVTDLAAAYLGTVRFTSLSHAGRVEECTPGALLLADAMFSCPRQPWSWLQREW